MISTWIGRHFPLKCQNKLKLNFLITYSRNISKNGDFNILNKMNCYMLVDLKRNKFMLH